MQLSLEGRLELLLHRQLVFEEQAHLARRGVRLLLGEQLPLAGQRGGEALEEGDRLRRAAEALGTRDGDGERHLRTRADGARESVAERVRAC